MNSFFKILRNTSLLQNSVRCSYNSTLSPKVTNDRKKIIKRRCCFHDLFVIVRAVPNEFPDILDLFRDSFYKREPTFVGIGLAGKRNAAFDDQLMSGLCQGMTLVAKCRLSGLIAGACVNLGTCQWDSYRASRRAENCNCEKMKEMLKFFAFISQAPDLYNRCHQNKIFEITYLATDHLNIGQGIGYHLVKKSMELGKDLSYKLIRVDCTSYYSAVICERLKMQKVFEIAYKDYVGPDGTPIIQPPKPHTTLKVYVDFPHKCAKK